MKKTWPLFLAFAVLLAVGLGSSQQPPQQEQTETPRTLDDTQILVRVNLVNVLFTVMDKKNRFVLGLDKDDISVWEDGIPQEVRFFSRETNLPLRVGILIDTSNSVRGRLRFEQQAAVDFLAKALRPKRDLAFVVSFDVEAQLVQDLTDNTGDLADFKTDVEPVAFCRTNGCFVAGLGGRGQSGRIGGRIVVNSSRHDRDREQDQRQRDCNFHCFRHPMRLLRG